MSSPASAPDGFLPPGAELVPEVARVELERIALRWSQLPLDRARGALPVVRRVLNGLAGRTGDRALPDLGPSVVVDQLRVLVHDAYAAGRGGGIPEQLAELRRDLAGA